METEAIYTDIRINVKMSKTTSGRRLAYGLSLVFSDGLDFKAAQVNLCHGYCSCRFIFFNPVFNPAHSIA